MKFSLAVVLAALGMSDAKRVSSATQKKKALLRNAVPVNRDRSIRKLADDQEVQVSVYSKIVFQDCLSLTWQNENALGSSVYEATASGNLTPQTSYVVFKLVNTNSAYNQAADGLWMLPLADWIEATADDEEHENREYCEACEDSYDTCYPNQDGDAEEAQDGGERKLKKRKLTSEVVAHREAFSAIMGKRFVEENENYACYEYVDCTTCESKGCFEEDNQNDDNQNYCDQDAYVSGCTFDDDAIKDFLENSACSQTGLSDYASNGEATTLYAGLMCNSDGSGVEMAMFADQYCSLYYNKKSFSSAMAGTYLYSLLNYTASSIMKPYVNSIDCMQCGYSALGQDDQNNGRFLADQEGNGEEPEAAEACQDLMEAASNVETCSYDQYEANQEQANQDGNGQSYPDIWSTYDFTNGQQPEANEVCAYLQGLNGEWKSKHVFNSDSKSGGGNFFDYGSASGSSSGGSSAGKTFGIIVAVAIVVVAGVMIMQNFNSKRDSKKVPLVGGNKGAMA